MHFVQNIAIDAVQNKKKTFFYKYLYPKRDSIEEKKEHVTELHVIDMNQRISPKDDIAV